jgi:hypothetical protein
MRFTPFAGLNRLRELGGAEFGRLIDLLSHELKPDIFIVDWGCAPDGCAAEYIKLSAVTVLVSKFGGVKSPPGAGGSLLSLADEMGADKDRVVAVVNRTPTSQDADVPYGGASSGGASFGGDVMDAAGGGDGGAGSGAGGVSGEAGRVVEISDDPYAFDSDAGRVSISLATAFGAGVKRLADAALGADDESPAVVTRGAGEAAA